MVGVIVANQIVSVVQNDGKGYGLCIGEELIEIPMEGLAKSKALFEGL